MKQSKAKTAAAKQQGPEESKTQDIGELIKKFHQVSKELASSTEDLEVIALRYEMALEHSPTAMIMTDDQGIISLVNKQTETLFGYERNELLKQPIDLLVPTATKAQHPTFVSSFFDDPEARSMGSARDLEGRRKDGSSIPVEIGLNPIQIDNKVYVLAAINDISERKEAELKEKRYKRQLERTNADLNDFAYIASHDLKAPLRGISNLVSWIEEDIQENLEDDTRENMNLLKNRVSRLDSLLDDLLAYSRAGRKREENEDIDVEELVHGLTELLDDKTNTLNTTIVGKLPILHTQRAAIDLVFRNLIDNAIKHHDQREIHITIACEELAQSYIFSVTDDGAGIAPEYHDRVFGMFKTLRPRDEVEGSGMGLALVKKIVEAQGGSIEAISPVNADGRGSSFKFEWYKKSAEEL